MNFRPALAFAIALALVTGLLPRAARADIQIGRFYLEFRNSNYNLKTGDIVLTGGVSGHGPDGDFRADRAFGNRERQIITLVGNVEAHRKAATQSITLRSDTATIDENSRTYIASGNASAQVGPRTMSADQMRFDDAAHVFTLSGSVHIAEPLGRTLQTNELIFHDDTGDVLCPGPLSGTTADGNFRADRAEGNLKRSIVTLSGGVVMHSGGLAAGGSQQPIALYADTVNVDGGAKLVIASGNVKVEQGTQTLSGPLLRLDNAAGTLSMTGGVHGEQPPDRVFDTDSIVYNLNSGAVSAPKPVRGSMSEGDFSADSASGNLKARRYDLYGRVVLHTSGKSAKGPTRTPTALTAHHVHLDELAKLYVAEGDAKVAQGDRTVAAPLMVFDDKVHIVKMTGGVHATQLPDRSADTAQITYHTDTGALLAPSQVLGRSSTDSFRADRAFGNAKSDVYHLAGNVVARRITKKDKDPMVLTADAVRIDGKARTYTATGHPKIVQGARIMTGQIISLNDTTHVLRVSGGVHAEEPPGRVFDTPELTYNTQSDDFKMLGGIRAIFPLGRPSPTPTPVHTPAGFLAPQAPSPFSTSGTPAQYASPSPTPTPTPSASPH